MQNFFKVNTLKVLLVVTGLGMGGAEHVVVNLADELVNRGHEVKIAYLTGPELVLPSNKKIEVVGLSMNSYKNLPSSYLKLRKLIKSFNPDVVHSHMFHANILTRLLNTSTNIPKLISTVHSTNEGGKIRMLAYRMTDKLTDISTNVSNEAVSEYVRKGAVKPNRMVSIANGIDTEKFSFNRAARNKKRQELSIGNEKILLAVGRLDKPKDYPNLLNAIAILQKTRKDFKVFIVGDGPLKDELHNLSKSLKLDGLIEFLGIRRDVNELMSATDIYVMSSAWEGLPMVILESMSSERIVVTTDCGGTKEVVDGVGFVIPPNDPEALASELNKVLDMSDEENLMLGCKARQHIVDNYSLKNNTNAYMELYLN